CMSFLSSTRRHTSFSRDWSSDVCSSDLTRPGTTGSQQTSGHLARRQTSPALGLALSVLAEAAVLGSWRFVCSLFGALLLVLLAEIGRASCRERGVSLLVCGSVWRTDQRR